MFGDIYICRFVTSNAHSRDPNWSYVCMETCLSIYCMCWYVCLCDMYVYVLISSRSY